jgi:general secretion pathway protein G
MPTAHIMNMRYRMWGEQTMVQVVRSNRAARRAAFTLVEVLIVVAILVVLAGVGGITYMKYLEDSRKDRAKIDIKSLSTAVEAFQIKHGSPPDSLATLTQPDADGSRPAISNAEILRDPWGNAYQYDPAGGRNNGAKPDVWTQSPDGIVIGNWALR